MSQRSRTLLAFTAMAVVAVSAARAAGSAPVNLGPFVNADLTTYTDGFNYPQSGGPLTVAGIPFSLTTGLNGRTAVVQGTFAPVAQTYSIPVGVFGVTSAYALVDSAFGVCTTPVGELDFVGAASGTFVFPLTEGTNVRDHYSLSGFCQTVTNVAGTANFGTVRLDMVQVTLPASFASDTLVRIDFKSAGAGGGGAPFLAAATVVAAGAGIPTLSGWALVIFGLLLAGVSTLALRRA